MSELTREDVVRLAGLARLDLDPEEVDRYRRQLGDILAAVERVSAVAAEDVEPMSHPQPLVNAWRADQVVAGVDRDEVLGAAPAAEDGRFRVPQILEEG